MISFPIKNSANKIYVQAENLSARRGVTLVEILISLTILVLVTGALSSGTNYLTRRLVRAKKASIARNLAWKRLAEIKASELEPGRRSGVFGREFSDYKYDEELKPAIVKGQQVRSLYEYELIVSWSQAYNREQISLQTYIADYLQNHEMPASETVEINER
ncbi:MAG: type IV pilus modification PilV family protein [Candidatus Rifleibacteriota bacterium]